MNSNPSTLPGQKLWKGLVGRGHLDCELLLSWDLGGENWYGVGRAKTVGVTFFFVQALNNVASFPFIEASAAKKDQFHCVVCQG